MELRNLFTKKIKYCNVKKNQIATFMKNYNGKRNPKSIDFIYFWDKASNWSKRAVSALHAHKQSKATIYWIGIIKLEEVFSELDYVNLYYISRNGVIRRDEYTTNDSRNIPFRYPVKYPADLKNVMLDAKKDEHKFFHVLIEETCTKKGAHTVSLLSSKTMHPYGFPSKVSILEMRYSELKYYSHVSVEEMRRVILLKN